MKREVVGEWAVYRMPVKGCAEGLRGVCPQDEWEALDRAKPGVYVLIQGHLRSEGQAEQLARGRSGEKPDRAARLTARLEAAEAKPVGGRPVGVGCGLAGESNGGPE
jgi:hypothetical protein